MRTILSYGMGVESSAILVRWLEEPTVRPCDLSKLVVISAQTGDEYTDTQRDIEVHILPRLRAHNVRFVQVARSGRHQKDGITVLSDSRETTRLHIEGHYKLSDELRAAGTVPQFAGEHICSLKFKAWVIERWLAENIGAPSLHAFGYNAEETKRVLKSEEANARRIAFGFNSAEIKRVARAISYDTAARQSFYPLVEWGWTRQACIDYLRATLGITWRKSACVYCPFTSLKDDAIERHKEHPDQVADALMLEHLSLSLNPRGQLYRDHTLVAITDSSGNQIATDAFRGKLDTAPWAIYRVRRIYRAGKDSDGTSREDRKGNVIRAVERISPPTERQAAIEKLRNLPGQMDTVERHGITYVYRQRCAETFPTKEEFLVAMPAVVESKARYGLEWFEEQWDAPQLSLFT